MKKTLVFILSILCFQTTFAQSLNWVKQAGAATRANYGNAVATDASGNVYVTGRFNGTTNFGGTTLTAVSIDIYIAKYSSSGTLQWVKQAGGAGSFNWGYSIAVDGLGNVYVTGYIAGTTNFDGITLNIIGNNDVFIAKYNNSGTIQWAKNIGAAGKYNIGYGIAIGVAGNVNITGTFQGTTNFGGLTLTSVGTNDIFVASYSNAGTLIWVNQAGAVGSSDNIGNGIATDANSNIYVTGKFARTTNFSGTTLTSTGNYDMFIASYSSSGTLQWVKHAGTPSIQNPGFITSFPAFGTAVTVNSSGNVYVTGKFTGSTDFGGIVLNPVAFSDVFVAKYSTIGSLSWVNQIGKIDRNNFSYGISADAVGNCYLTGEFGGSADFGGTTLTAIGTRDAYVAKYNNSGSLQWVKQAGSTGKFNSGFGIATDASGSVYSVGYFSGTTNFGGITLSPVGVQDMFVWSLQTSACPSAITPSGIVINNQKAGSSVSTTGINTIPNASNVTYQAGNYVQLNAGFSAVNGSVFTAKILAGCQ